MKRTYKKIYSFSSLFVLPILLLISIFYTKKMSFLHVGFSILLFINAIIAIKVINFVTKSNLSKRKSNRKNLLKEIEVIKIEIEEKKQKKEKNSKEITRLKIELEIKSARLSKIHTSYISKFISNYLVPTKIKFPKIKLEPIKRPEKSPSINNLTNQEEDLYS